MNHHSENLSNLFFAADLIILQHTKIKTLLCPVAVEIAKK